MNTSTSNSAKSKDMPLEWHQGNLLEVESFFLLLLFLGNTFRLVFLYWEPSEAINHITRVLLPTELHNLIIKKRVFLSYIKGHNQIHCKCCLESLSKSLKEEKKMATKKPKKNFFVSLFCCCSCCCGVMVFGRFFALFRF